MLDKESFPWDLLDFLLEDQGRRIREWTAAGKDTDAPLLGFYLADAEGILEMLKRCREKAKK